MPFKKVWLKMLSCCRRMNFSSRKSRLFQFLLAVSGLFFYCEFLIYYVSLLQCSWPLVDRYHGTNPHSLRVMILADTHLLGYFEGHWFDKLRREWQMERSFQTVMTIHSPDVVFILGDLLDEGKWCSDEEFREHVKRFQKMFRHSDDTQLHVVAGNHDIGFHYALNKHKVERFRDAFRSPSVRMIQIKNNVFVLVNSMAFEGDECFLCKDARLRLNDISKQLNCSKDPSLQHCKKIPKFTYSRPILLQHFPLYRRSDSNCTGPDAIKPEKRNVQFEEKWDTVSKKSTDEIINLLQPRLAFSGHTHHGCETYHRGDIPEHTVASFSWRYKPNPSFILASVSSNHYKVSKCYIPQESTVISIYIIGAISILCWFILPCIIFHPKFKLSWKSS